ncbi:DoxX family protein [Caldivirga maquilingensis]|uniref:DoxX family protein n=1 Tax=Caldivirga maquilingensis (strain ATCC 700844 / DSM 13496 / JCM 10307 / IC-167) TaxID=397948 RepID=A8ME93_CALMQ|nr:DoxX family protein [Caldivirga maquilingensis]ABW02099.1 DoxX family protein [Caldivirga maquilingensis IC-167]
MSILGLILGTYSGYLTVSVAALVLRVFVGVNFMVHGLPKLTGESRRSMRDGLTKLLNIPGALFDLTALLEFIGGLVLVLGLLTRIAAILLALEMVITTILYITKLYNAPLPRGWTEPMFKATKGYMFGWELDTLLLASSIALAVIGPGALSIDHLILAYA